MKASHLLFDLTEKQLKDWGCKYNTLILGKPHADFFIDDKGVNSDDFLKCPSRRPRNESSRTYKVCTEGMGI